MKILLLIILTLSTAHQTCADVLVVVNKTNNTTELSKSEVIDIFLGRLVAFPDGSTAQPIDNANSEIKNRFYIGLTNLNIARINAYWSRLKFSGKALRPLELENETQVINQLKNEDLAISYIDSTSLTEDLRVIYTINE